jgi:hypothetical protein
MKVCHRCHEPWSEPGQPGFNNTCNKCGIPLHSCGNCVHFVRSGAIRCTIPTAARILDWQAGNRCKDFEFQDLSVGIVESMPGSASNGHGRSAKDRWNELFSKA